VVHTARQRVRPNGIQDSPAAQTLFGKEVFQSERGGVKDYRSLAIWRCARYLSPPQVLEQISQLIFSNAISLS